MMCLAVDVCGSRGFGSLVSFVSLGSLLGSRVLGTFAGDCGFATGARCCRRMGCSGSDTSVDTASAAGVGGCEACGGAVVSCVGNAGEC